MTNKTKGLTQTADAESGRATTRGSASQPRAVGGAVAGAVVACPTDARVVLEAHDGEERED